MESRHVVGWNDDGYDSLELTFTWTHREHPAADDRRLVRRPRCEKIELGKESLEECRVYSDERWAQDILHASCAIAQLWRRMGDVREDKKCYLQLSVWSSVSFMYMDFADEDGLSLLWA